MPLILARESLEMQFYSDLARKFQGGGRPSLLLALVHHEYLARAALIINAEMIRNAAS
jgi:hypothetical protein